MSRWSAPDALIAPEEKTYTQKTLFYWPESPFSKEKRKRKKKPLEPHEYLKQELPLTYSRSKKQRLFIKIIDPCAGYEGDIEKERREKIKDTKVNGLGSITSPSLCEEHVLENLYGELPAYRISVTIEDKFESESKPQIYGKLYHKLAQIVTMFFVSRNYYNGELSKDLIETLTGKIDLETYRSKKAELTSPIRQLSGWFDEVMYDSNSLGDAIDLDSLRESMKANYENLDEDVLQFCLKVVREWKAQIKSMSSELHMSDELFEEIFNELKENILEYLNVLDSILKILHQSFEGIQQEDLRNLITEQLIMVSYRIPRSNEGFYYERLNKLDEIRITSRFKGDLIIIYQDTCSNNSNSPQKLNVRVVDFKLHLGDEHRNPDLASSLGKMQYLLGAQALVNATGGAKYNGFIISKVNPYELDLSRASFYYGSLETGELLNATPRFDELSTLTSLFQQYIETKIMFKKTLSNVVAES